MGWVYLIFDIVLEVSGTVSMKLSAGLTKLTPSILIFVFYTSSLYLLTFALRTIDFSVAYAIWSGIGTALIAVIGYLAFKETMDFTKVLGILLIIFGAVVVNLKGASH